MRAEQIVQRGAGALVRDDHDIGTRGLRDPRRTQVYGGAQAAYAEIERLRFGVGNHVGERFARKRRVYHHQIRCFGQQRYWREFA